MDKAVLTHPDIKAEMAAVTKEVGEEGRILLRPSGTETAYSGDGRSAR